MSAFSRSFICVLQVMTGRQPVSRQPVSRQPVSRQRSDDRKGFSQAGYSLMETMLLVGLGLVIAGITATYTLYGIRRQSQSDTMTQRELFRLRSMLLKAHMRAQRGTSTTVTLPAPELSLDFRQSPSTLVFMAPDGRLQNAPAEGICFYAGKDQVWHRFRFGTDGMPEISPVSEAPPGEPPGDATPPPNDGPPNDGPPDDGPPDDGPPDDGPLNAGPPNDCEVPLSGPPGDNQGTNDTKPVHRGGNKEEVPAGTGHSPGTSRFRAGKQ